MVGSVVPVAFVEVYVGVAVGTARHLGAVDG